ncbi:MAG: extracellular solute-binding protein [Oscillospiraceae bacterium]|nr:extracellular solute-binding protein [Oscillospiraceae bacterium]
MKLRRILSLFIVLALSFSLVVGCNGEDPVTPPPVGSETNGNGNNGSGSDSNGGDSSDPWSHMPVTGVMPDGSVRDLGGMVIEIGCFWVPDVVEPTTEYNRARLEYRDYIMTRHNFTMREVEIGGHGDHADIIAATTLANNPIAAINNVDPGRVVSLVRNNMFFDVSQITGIDLTVPKWNSHIREAMSFDGGTYGFVHNYNQFNAGVIFFNKDVLREAGIDPELPYDLQLANEWTWDAMLEIAEAVTRDVDGDGIIDYFGFCLFSNRTMLSAMASNGARFIGRDDNGRFYNAASGSLAALQAFDHVRDFATRELTQPQPEGVAYDWWRDGFREGRAAFLVYEEFGKDDFATVPFDWGMVLYPRGPQMDKLTSIYYENVKTIPSVFSLAEAEDIIFAYDLWTNEPPGYEDDGMAWKYELYERYRDSRAVDETVAMIRSGDYTTLRLDGYVMGGEDVGLFTYDVWNMEHTGAQLLESASQIWDTRVNTANTALDAWSNN